MQHLHRDRLHVLIVDDEEVVRNGLSKSECFPKAGYRVVGSASDGKAALTMTQQLQPDLIVTDINMPVMDGLSFMQALREAGDATAVLILSCYDDFEYAQRAIRLEVASYLLKPFTDEELTEALERVKKQLESRTQERRTQEMERFLLHGKEHILKDLLQQAVVRGGREEIIRNIHHLGLMQEYSLYAMAFFKDFTAESREKLTWLLPKSTLQCYLLNTSEQDFLVLVACGYVSASRFQEEMQQLLCDWNHTLDDDAGIVVHSEIFTSLENAHEHFSQLLTKIKQLEEEKRNSVRERPENRKEIQQAIAFIREHYCEESLCLHAVAESIPISPFYFSRLFTQEVGVSFVRYVNTFRVEKACSLLRENKLRIYEISKAVGFQNETYFHQVFKSIKKVTPKRYQRELHADMLEAEAK